MAILPLADTSEPRYAEIARYMLESNDWITPWFTPDSPFWGKPPLSFWVQALSFKFFGINEFAARLPSLLSAILTLLLLRNLALQLLPSSTAALSLVIYVSTAVVFVTSGAVLTDPVLTLGVTLSLTSVLMTSKHTHWLWRFGFFIGLALGMLAKGPIALVITFPPVLVWALITKEGAEQIRKLPWGWGSLLFLILVLPWYVMAEIKTPGFLKYFIIGEHFLRYVDAGWEGDLYGSAHKRPTGTIWLYWLLATFPWGINALPIFGTFLKSAQVRTQARQSITGDPAVVLLLVWALVTPVFFTFAGNILWTYLLPSVPPLSLLLARVISSSAARVYFPAPLRIMAPGLTLGLALLYAIAVAQFPELHKSEKGLIRFIENDNSCIQVSSTAATPLVYYLDRKLPFSARFYSHGRAVRLDAEQLPEISTANGCIWLAIEQDEIDDARRYMGRNPADVVYEAGRYSLLSWKMKPSAPENHKLQHEMQTEWNSEHI